MAHGFYVAAGEKGIPAAAELPFEIAGGTVTGHAHTVAGRNNQDAFCWTRQDAGLVAVVCDGCSSGAHSEVGAQLGARLIAQAAARRLTSGLAPAVLLEQVRQEVLAQLHALALALSTSATGEVAPARERVLGAPAPFSRTVSDYFLFTVVGALIADERLTTFSIGDGLIVLNGERRELGPFANNEPPYLGYALLPRGAVSGSSAQDEFQIHQTAPLPAAELRSLLLGSDGAGDLDGIADLWTDDRCFRNADMVRRRLTLASRGAAGGRLADDTTVVVLRRKAAEARA